MTIPIKYRQVYSDSDYQGFTPFKDDLGYHSKRIIEIEPFKWKGGSMLLIRIIDAISPEDNWKYEKTMLELEIYDYVYSSINQIIKPNEIQRLIMSGLANNEIKGDTAEKMVHNLMVDFLFKNENSGIDKFLPEVVKFWKNGCKWERIK